MTLPPTKFYGPPLARQPNRPPDDASLDALAVAHAAKILADRSRSPAAALAALSTLFDRLAQVKRERDDADLWWRSVIEEPVQARNLVPRGFASRNGSFQGPMARTLAQVRTAVVRVDCPACGRQGQHQLSELLVCYGPSFGLPDLLRVLAGDCAEIQAVGLSRCKMRFSAPVAPDYAAGDPDR